jgi:hypothetical protein
MHLPRGMTDRAARRWIWLAIAVQALGYIVDAFWHARLEPGRAPTTVAEIARHLATVHLPLYLGAVAVLVATAVAVEHRTRYAPAGFALPIALIAAALSAFGEAWHAIAHLSLDAHHAPIFGLLSVAGFFTVIVATVLSGRTRRRRRVTTRRSRSAAA